MPKQGGICIWTVYDEDGRMIGVSTKNGEDITFDCDVVPAYAKLFILDRETSQPTCLETPCVLEARDF